MVDYDNSGRIKDLFQTFPQALNHEIDDLHRGLLAHFFFSYPFFITSGKLKCCHTGYQPLPLPQM